MHLTIEQSTSHKTYSLHVRKMLRTRELRGKMDCQSDLCIGRWFFWEFDPRHVLLQELISHSSQINWRSYCRLLWGLHSCQVCSRPRHQGEVEYQNRDLQGS